MRKKTGRERTAYMIGLPVKYDYLIVGAGLYGATFARLMTDTGKKCLVIDRRDHRVDYLNPAVRAELDTQAEKMR